jgi:molybdopterin synthase catalytic subunit
MGDGKLAFEQSGGVGIFVGILRERNKKNKKYRDLRTILDPVRSARP